MAFSPKYKASKNIPFERRNVFSQKKKKKLDMQRRVHILKMCLCANGPKWGRGVRSDSCTRTVHKRREKRAKFASFSRFFDVLHSFKTFSSYLVSLLVYMLALFPSGRCSGNRGSLYRSQVELLINASPLCDDASTNITKNIRPVANKSL